MSNRTLQLHSLSLQEGRTYLFATLFIAGNIILPQLCHLIPEGGLRLLPIYLFTLIGAYKYGANVGLLTAVASPVINSLLFGMPAAAMLPIIVIKSILLALAAAYAAQTTRRATLFTLVAVVAFYQGVGSLVEWAATGSFAAATQDIALGIPGIAIQIFGGWFIINNILKK